MGGVKVESHNMGPSFSRLTSYSFHVNWAALSWVTTYQNLTLKFKGQWHGWGSQFKVAMWVWHTIDTHPFRSMSVGPPIPEIQQFQSLTLKIQGTVKWPWCCTTRGLDNSIKLQMVEIHPVVTDIWMVSAMSVPSALWFEKFLAHGQTHIGQMGKWPWQCTTTGLDNSTEHPTEKIRQSLQIYEFRKSGSQYPSSTEGWGVKAMSTI